MTDAPTLCPLHGSYTPCPWCAQGAPDFREEPQPEAAGGAPEGREKT